jgi:hypothetical protein
MITMKQMQAEKLNVVCNNMRQLLLRAIDGMQDFAIRYKMSNDEIARQVLKTRFTEQVQYMLQSSIVYDILNIEPWQQVHQKK